MEVINFLANLIVSCANSGLQILLKDTTMPTITGIPALLLSLFIFMLLVWLGFELVKVLILSINNLVFALQKIGNPKLQSLEDLLSLKIKDLDKSKNGPIEIIKIRRRPKVRKTPSGYLITSYNPDFNARDLQSDRFIGILESVFTNQNFKCAEMIVRSGDTVEYICDQLPDFVDPETFLKTLPPGYSFVGIDNRQRPQLINLCDSPITTILGAPKSGKTTTATTLILSALKKTKSVSVSIISPKGEVDFQTLDGLPNVEFINSNLSDAIEKMRCLLAALKSDYDIKNRDRFKEYGVRDMESLLQKDPSTSERIFITLIDECESLFPDTGASRELKEIGIEFKKRALEGRSAGHHFIFCTQSQTDQCLLPLKQAGTLITGTATTPQVAQIWSLNPALALKPDLREGKLLIRSSMGQKIIRVGLFAGPQILKK